MAWPTRALSRSKSGGTSLCISVALQETTNLAGAKGEMQCFKWAPTLIISNSWMILATCNTYHLGHLHRPEFFHQLLPGRSFIFWKYATGRQNAASGTMTLGENWDSSRDSRVGIRMDMDVFTSFSTCLFLFGGYRIEEA